MLNIYALDMVFANYYSLYCQMKLDNIKECKATLYYIGDDMGTIHLTIEQLKRELDLGNFK